MKNLMIIVILVLINWVLADADFGDAPDSTKGISTTAGFPTMASNKRPFHSLAASSTFWIGALGTGPSKTTTMEVDALVTNRIMTTDNLTSVL